MASDIEDDATSGSDIDKRLADLRREVIESVDTFITNYLEQLKGWCYM
jgi:hypothetical protein